jgi:hypothetical protein
MCVLRRGCYATGGQSLILYTRRLASATSSIRRAKLSGGSGLFRQFNDAQRTAKSTGPSKNIFKWYSQVVCMWSLTGLEVAAS